MLDRFLIHRDPLVVDTSQQILDSSLTAFSRVLNLNTSWHLSIYRDLWLFYIKAFRDFSSFLLDLSRLFLVFSPPKHSILFQTFNPRDFRPFLISDHLVWSLYLSFFMHFMHLDLGFGFFEKILGFFKINEVFVKFLGWVLCKWF